MTYVNSLAELNAALDLIEGEGWLCVGLSLAGHMEEWFGLPYLPEGLSVDLQNCAFGKMYCFARTENGEADWVEDGICLVEVNGEYFTVEEDFVGGELVYGMGFYEEFKDFDEKRMVERFRKMSGISMPKPFTLLDDAAAFRWAGCLADCRARGEDLYRKALKSAEAAKNEFFEWCARFGAVPEEKNLHYSIYKVSVLGRVYRLEMNPLFPDKSRIESYEDYSAAEKGGTELQRIYEELLAKGWTPPVG